MTQFDKYLFASEPADLVGKTEEFVYELENSDFLSDDLLSLFNSKPLAEIANNTTLLVQEDFNDKYGMVKDLAEFWIRCILLTNKIVESDNTINLARDLNSSFDDLVKTIGEIDVLRADENIFPFITKLNSSYYSNDNIPELLKDFTEFLSATKDTIHL